MAEKSVYDIIKKQNGEAFARVLRSGNLLDIPELANIVRYAGRTAADAEGLVPYLWSLKSFDEDSTAVPGDPFELLHQAGYEFVEYADTLEKQNAIQKYFANNERLCTFKDENRYKNYYILNAVKQNIDGIKRSKKPSRQDEYGTSVISIQMLKEGGFISIKNRYNHTVMDPDNTFDSNPDNIILGLSAALKAYFNVDWKNTGVALPSGFTVIGGMIIKYNCEVNNVYFGDTFYESHGTIQEIDKRSQIMMDYFIWDNKQKQLLNPSGAEDDFVNQFNKEIADKKVVVQGRWPKYSITADGQEIVRTENGKIVAVNMPNATVVGDRFLMHNRGIRELKLPNASYIGEKFLMLNRGLTEIDLPNVRHIGDFFVSSNHEISTLNLPYLVEVGNHFLKRNSRLTAVKLPVLEKIGNDFIGENFQITRVYLPRVESIGNAFLGNNLRMTQIELPMVRDIGDEFMAVNHRLRKIKMPKVASIGRKFMYNNARVTQLGFSELQNVGSDFMFWSRITNISLPQLKIIGDSFLGMNKRLRKLSLPQVNYIGSGFLQHNDSLKRLDLPIVEKIGNDFLGDNVCLGEIFLPNVQTVGKNFLSSNMGLKRIYMPKLRDIKDGFLTQNRNIDIKNIRDENLYGVKKSIVQKFHDATQKLMVKINALGVERSDDGNAM